MNKTKAVNRLYLGAVLWALGSGIGIGWLPFTGNLTMGQLMALSQILYILPIIVFMLVKKVKPWKWMPFKPLQISTLLMTALYTALLMPLVTLLNMISMLFVENVFASSQAEIAGNSVWMNLLVMAVLPAVCEEVTYRGIYYNAYRQRGVWCAILGSALAFGLMHMNFNQFFYAFALGIAFGLLLEATGSIFATMTAHFIVNGWSVVLMALTHPAMESAGAAAQAEMTNNMLMTAICVYAVIAAVCTCLAGAVLVWIASHCKRLPHLKWCFCRREKRPGCPHTMFTPSFGIAVGIIIAFMIITAV